MLFLKPEYLLFMLIPLIVLFYFIVTGKSQIQTIFAPKILKKITIDNDSLGRVGRNMMLFIALFLMIVALARPVLIKGEIEASNQSIDLLVALDISKSMLATDRYPNRLEFAKQKIYELLQKFEEARIGIIAFADDGFIVSPLTSDKNTLAFLIENLNTNALSTNGTNLLIPILKAKESLKEHEQKILLIFSDGGDQKDFSQEIKEAQSEGVKLYIYGIGTQQGAPIPFHGENLKDKEGNLVITHLNNNIKELAIKSQGAYIEGGYKDKSIEMLIQNIKSRFHLQTLKTHKIQDFQELFYYPLALALLFMLFAFSSLPRYTKSLLPLLLLIVPTPHKLYAGLLDFHKIDQGISLYNQASYRDAIKHFEYIAKSRQDAPSYYDLGNAYYKAGLYQKALDAYKHVHTNNPHLVYKLFFNFGNTYYRLQNYSKALNAYEYAKKHKSTPDLLYNIELTKKHLKKEPPNSQKQNAQKKKNNKEEENQKQKEEKSSSKKEQPPQKGKGENSQNEAKKMKRNKESMSEKELKKWEQRLKNSHPKTIPLRFRLQNLKREKNAKPW